MEESQVDDRKQAELDTIAERLGRKKRVPSAEQEGEKIIKAQKVASQELQKHINATYKESPGAAPRQELAYYSAQRAPPLAAV